MDHICTRCARSTLQNTRSSIRLASAQAVRRFSSSPFAAKDEASSRSIDLSQTLPSSSSTSPQPTKSRFGSQVDAAVQNASRSLNIKNPPQSEAPRRPHQPRDVSTTGRRVLDPAPGGQLLIRRVDPSSSKPSPSAYRPRGQLPTGQTDSATSSLPSASRAPPAGQLLIRRTGAGPNTTAPKPFRARGPPSDRTPGQRQTSQNRDRLRRSSQNQKRTTQSSEDEALEAAQAASASAALDAYIARTVDPPPTSPVALPYSPEELSVEELREDWPNTPLSIAGLTESVVQRVTGLARRLPHGYVTPETLAERFTAGHFVRFESAEEKEEVVKIAGGMAGERAKMLTERKGEEVAAQDMRMADLAGRKDERDSVVQGMVQGKYPEMEKQRMPFLDGIVRQLRNNETYGTVDAAKFMAKIEGLMPAQKRA